MKINYPTQPGEVLTIRAEVDGAKVVAHIAPVYITAVGVINTNLVLNILGCEGHNQFMCESREQAEEIANSIADCMEKARK